jgi:hypothetical protein
MKIRKGCDAVHVDGIAVAGSGAGGSVERGYGERVEGGEGWPLSSLAIFIFAEIILQPR